MDRVPADGLLVLELASVLAGPTVGQFLAELGARVIKIENPRVGGDVTRSWRLADESGSGVSSYFASCNLGKESIALALDTAQGRVLLRKLAARADVAIASFLPGHAERLGADDATLRAANPRLVYASISGYGPTVPRAGYDAVLQAETGFMHMNGSPDGPPTKMPVALVDLLAAHHLKEAILLALWRRERTGEGATVDVSLFDTAVSSLANQGANWLNAGVDAGRMGSEHPNIAPYGMAFECLDRRSLVVAVGTDRQFEALSGILGDESMASDERYRTNRDRVANRDGLREKLGALFLRRPSTDLLARFEEARIPAGSIRSVGETLSDALSRDLVLGGRAVPSGADGGREPGAEATSRGAAAGLRQAVFTTPDGAASGAARRPDVAGLLPAPPLGAHTERVLAELAGVGPDEWSRLVRDGVVA